MGMNILKLHLFGLIVNVMIQHRCQRNFSSFVFGFYVEILKQQVIYLFNFSRFTLHAARLKVYFPPRLLFK